GRLNENGYPIALAVPTLPVGVDGQHDVVVLRLTEGRAEGFSDTDDLIGMTLRANRFTDGIDVRKEFGGDIGADEGDIGAMIVVGLREVAALRDIDVADIGEVWRNPHDGGAFHQEVVVVDLGDLVLFGSHGGGDFHGVAQPLKVFHFDHRALLRLDEFVSAG